MAENRRCGSTAPLGIEQILFEAQSRWLRPVEICEVLRNYDKFQIAPEPPDRPPSGSLFLFDRKKLRYFRKDGHNWRKKKDGKTVREAHERLKAGSIDVLHCYYAHGEENENFQRRSYWMLEEDLMHIVLVHYRDVKGNRTNLSREAEEISQSPSIGSSHAYSSIHTNYDPSNSHATDTSSRTSTFASENEDPESADLHQASSRYHSLVELQHYEDIPVTNQMNKGLLENYLSGSSSVHVPARITYDAVTQGNGTGINGDGSRLNFSDPGKKVDTEYLAEGVSEQCFLGSLIQPVNIGTTMKVHGRFSQNELRIKEENGDGFEVSVDSSSFQPMGSIDQERQRDSTYTGDDTFGRIKSSAYLSDSTELFSTSSYQENRSALPNELHTTISSTDIGSLTNANIGDNDIYLKEVTRPLLEGEVLKKSDSFSHWMSKELGVVGEAHAQSTSADIWTTVEDGDAIEVSTLSPNDRLDDYVLSPSLSQDQLFSIQDFAPNWAYEDVETKVLVMGTFLKEKNETENYRWSCMFGEVEVPAEILAEGVLRCYTPGHKAGRVPFYVTCSNRLACSEVREFEYRVCHTRPVDTSDDSDDEFSLKIRLGKLLSLDSYDNVNHVSDSFDKHGVKEKINLLLKDHKDDLPQKMMHLSKGDLSLEMCKEQLLQNLYEEQLHAWLLRKMCDDGKGPNILDKEGQGAIHLVAALGYDWAIEPIIGAGVNINFRDVHGWTALHWAASYGRERTVATLVSLGGASGALTDPTPEFPSGKTPADLASINGHKGISGFLAESSLTTHLSNLTLKVGLKDVNELDSGGENAIQTVTQGNAVFHGDGGVPEGLSLKDSLAAVCNATQAAARIHQVFRIQSFQRKQVIEYEGNNYDISDEQAISLIAIKPNKPGKNDLLVNSAAIRIQKKFRGWKGRKEFLIMRKRIVKIQALVRGHQVRMKYKKIIWSVGIVEKVILRWRRKGSGLRGFRSEALAEGSSMQTESSNEDDYDFLREGRKQTEARLEKALARVKSMVQYPEARDQYSRLLTVVTEIQDRKLLANESSDANMNEDMLDDLEDLLVDE